ncbi:MAG: hypothetical protein J7577_00820 [Sphingobacteriaceae bacterium]|nr:hypothetical protein [Sphingobacteriaceae bacterium]
MKGAIKYCKTFNDFKDLVAIRKQWVDFKDFYDFYSKVLNGHRVINEFLQKAADLYADYKSKEAIRDYAKKQKSKVK